MYIESSSPRRPNDKAQLYSKPYNPTAGSCLTFWYSMYGQDVGVLNVYIVPVGASLTHPTWSLSGDQHAGWHIAAFNVQSIERFQVCARGCLVMGRGGFGCCLCQCAQYGTVAVGV